MPHPAISVVAAVIRDNQGRVLVVRKRGTAAFMQPGGKRNPLENDEAALRREIMEELGCGLTAGSILALGDVECGAANEPGRSLKASLYTAVLEGEPFPGGEIEELAWIDPVSVPQLTLAPLTRDHVLPLVRSGR